VEYDRWTTRALAALEPVYLWVDGVYVKAGLEQDKAAMLVALAALRDGRKVIVAVESGHRESTESWAAWLRHLQPRGFRPPRLVIGDGHLGIWSALAAIYPPAGEQRCWTHRILNVLAKLPQRLQPEAQSLLTTIRSRTPGRAPSAPSGSFKPGAPRRGSPRSARGWTAIGSGWSPSISSRRRTGSICAPRTRSSRPARRGGCEPPRRSGTRKVPNATAVIWETLLIAERTFRRLDAPELLPEVAEGVVYVDGVRVKSSKAMADETAAA
jgi:hypothetical protein